MIDKRTKNGDIANALHLYHEQTKTWPNAPVMLSHNGAARLKSHRLLSVETEKFNPKGCGGRCKFDRNCSKT